MQKTFLSLALICALAFAGDYTNSIGMKFKDIPAGSFTMGSGYYENEAPAHRVTLKSFYMGETEVTQGQWNALMGNNPAEFKTGDENLPVEQVSWDAAQEFIKKLNAKEKGDKYRLPTEEEWEYAARAGTTTEWSCGEYESCADDIAWHTKNSGDRTHRVATKQSNAWGLYDMSGNVWEWTESCYTKTYNDGCYKNDKSVRGGSWYFGVDDTRSASRIEDAPHYRNSDVGFRLLRTK